MLTCGVAIEESVALSDPGSSVEKACLDGDSTPVVLCMLGPTRERKRFLT